MASEEYRSPFSFASFAFTDHASTMQPPSPQNDSDQTADMSEMLAFQLPTYFYNTPALANGGGAEVLPAGMLNGANWLANNGCTVKGKQKLAAYDDASYDELNFSSSTGGSRGVFDFEDMMPPVPSPTRAAQFSPQFHFETESAAPQPAAGHPLPHAQPPQAQAQHTQQQAQVPSDLIVASTLSHPLTTTSSLGLPLYSATGFDLLSVLARVYNRPYARINLGAVDLTCSFVVVDTRRYDHPIIYCSPSFAKLTGYEEKEILGRNCRFLQSPVGQMEPGGLRPDRASQDAASYLKKNLTADKECQTIVTNYRKDGTQFKNLVTVIPIPGGVSGGAHEEDNIVFHVGFQVDLTEQPKAIMDNVTRGKYLVEYPQSEPPHRASGGALSSSSRDRNRPLNLPPVLVSKEMKKIMANPAFLRSITITTTTNFPVAAGDRDAVAGTFQDPIYCGNHPLHMMLLEVGPDFVHVVSLKGNFLYVAPAIRRVLGYEPGDLVGATIADIAHQDDVVPVMRELKESTSTGLGAATENSLLGKEAQVSPRTVDVLFRARLRNGRFVWMESRGRLHAEPGKGRKAIILTGRAREMSYLTWDTVARAGGVAKSITEQRRDEDGDIHDAVVRQEFWGTLSNSGVFVTVGSGITDVLGWEPREFEGRAIGKLLVDASNGIEVNVQRLGRIGEDSYDTAWASSTCRMKTKEGGSKVVVVNIFRGQRDPTVRHATSIPGGVHPAHLMYQVRLASAETYSLYPSPSTTPTIPSRDPSYASSSYTSPISSTAAAQEPTQNPRHPDLKSNVFQSLDTNRNTSWQYAVKQLKFRNDSLKEEIARLEGAIRTAKARKAAQAQAAIAASSSDTSSGMYNGAMYHPHQSQQHREQPHRHRSNPMPPHPNLSINLSGLGYQTTAPLPLRTQAHGHLSSLHLDPLHALNSTRQPVPIATQHTILPPIPSHYHKQAQPEFLLPSPSQLLTSHPLATSPQAARKPYPGNEYTSSPFVQRVQNEVAAQMAQPQYADYGHGSASIGGGVVGVGQQTGGVKRNWTTMQGASRSHAPQPQSGYRWDHSTER